VTLVLDSGALIALERGDRAMWRRLKAAQLATSVPVSHGGVVGQAWRGGGPRQALLVKALEGIEVRPLDAALGRAAGELLARAGTRDVIDAALVLLAADGDDIVTSDCRDIEPLAALAGRHVELLYV
jgi:predicted nucleic acid-binding protein